jgi:hypothetical protein
VSTQAGFRVHVVQYAADGVALRDLGYAKTKSGGETTAGVTKSRPGGGEDPFVWAAPKETDDITVAFQAFRLRPNFAFCEQNVGRGKASITLIRLGADFQPVENLWTREALLQQLGDIETDADATEDVAEVELVYVIGKVGTP